MHPPQSLCSLFMDVISTLICKHQLGSEFSEAHVRGTKANAVLWKFLGHVLHINIYSKDSGPRLPLIIHAFIQQVFQCHLCTRPCAKNWSYRKKTG